MWKFSLSYIPLRADVALRKVTLLLSIDFRRIQEFLNGCRTSSKGRFIDQAVAAPIKSIHFCISFEILPSVQRAFASNLSLSSFPRVTCKREELRITSLISQTVRREYLQKRTVVF